MSVSTSYDVIVIGGGPGGYHAAIRAAQLGKKTAVVARQGRRSLSQGAHRESDHRCRGRLKVSQGQGRGSVDRGRPRLHRGRAQARYRGAGLEEAGVDLDDRGRVEIDELQRTSGPNIYAIGDLVSGPPLAHKAQQEGVVAAEAIAGAPTHPVDRDLVARATFCHPQVASVGMTEQQAKEAGKDVKVGKMKVGGVGASAIYDDRDGIVKLVVDGSYGEILGAHVVGNRACDMIAELVGSIASEGGYQELARTIRAHPTISEAILDAARAVDGRAIHA